MNNFVDDLRYAARMLRNSPGFTLVAMLTLALAIGATSSIFSVVNAALLRSLPYTDPDRLVLLWGTHKRADALNLRSQICFPDVEDWRKSNRSFEEIAAYAGWHPIVTGAGSAEKIAAVRVSPSYFSVMKTPPLLGRTFAPEENLGNKDSVIVIGYGLWQRKFGGDPGVIGKPISLNSGVYTIVGVMPPEFRPLPASLTGEPAELYRPLSKELSDEIRNGHHLRGIGRLKSGVSLENAQAELNVIARQLEQQYPDSNTGQGVRLVKLQDDLVRNVRSALIVLQTSVLAVMLIACANLANLLLARSTARRQEIAIRAALGAARSRLIRQMITESALLAALGGLAGILLAVFGVRALTAFGSKVIPELSAVRMDARVLAFTALVSALTGLIFGMAPAGQVAITSLITSLREGGRSSGTSSSRNRSRNLLVISEMALALVLLTCSGLLIRSFLNLRGVYPGFDARNVLTVNVGLPIQKYPSGARREVFFHDVLARVQHTPGVRSAAAVSVLPESANFNQMGMDIQGRSFDRGDAPSLDQYEVTPAYFRALSIPLLRGRVFSDGDDAGHSPVAIINETAARRLWGERDPIGAKVRTGGPDGLWRTIVGIVGDVYQYGLDSQKTMQIYVPYFQNRVLDMTLLVRTDVEPLSLASAVQSAVFAVDKDQPVTEIATMEEVLADSIAGRRFSTVLLLIFGSGALVLAAIGVYGVISYSVSQRTSEFGIRLALGAQRGDVLGMVLCQGLRLVLGGIALGLIAAFALTRLVASLLFGVSATDLLTFSTVPVILGAVALLASYVPAWRATHVDPMTALRYE